MHPRTVRAKKAQLENKRKVFSVSISSSRLRIKIRIGQSLKSVGRDLNVSNKVPLSDRALLDSNSKKIYFKA